jgi:hypothetical protein
MLILKILKVHFWPCELVRLSCVMTLAQCKNIYERIVYLFFKYVVGKTNITPNDINYKEISMGLSGCNSRLHVIEMLQCLVEVLSERCLLWFAK